MERRRNYQKELDKILSEINKNSIPKLLLHSCCAPCSSYCLEYLSEYFDITVFFYNPNIEPKEEYEFRKEEQKRLLSMMGFQEKTAFKEGRYDPEYFRAKVRGLENEPERGSRCDVCFRLRLNETALAAKENGFDFFTTTLSVSPLKSAEKLNSVGEELQEKYGVKYLSSDFKKRGGHQRTVELSKKYGLYRQDFCGCIYSKAQKQNILSKGAK